MASEVYTFLTAMQNLVAALRIAEKRWLFDRDTLILTITTEVPYFVVTNRLSRNPVFQGGEGELLEWLNTPKL